MKKRAVGELQLIVGPMFAGKTSELFRLIDRYTVQLHKAVVIRHCDDTRYSNTNATTHDAQVRRSISTHMLADVLHLVSAFDIIGVDEGQFYPDLVLIVHKWVHEMNKIVIVSALDGDFQQRPFGTGQVLELIPMAEKVTKLSAICHVCTQDAPFSRRITTETTQQVVGGDDKYIACCRQCLGMDADSIKDALTAHREAIKRSTELKLNLL